MFKVIFYQDSNGRSELIDYIKYLHNRNNKEARVNLSKILSYLRLLKKYGSKIGEPYVKHLEGKIWELRPLKNRILFAYVENNNIILLGYFIKKTKKTPKREIERAKKLLKKYFQEERNEKK